MEEVASLHEITSLLLTRGSTSTRDVHRAFTYRLDPTVKQAQGLKRLMALQCELYNAALEERTMTYEWLKRGISTKKVPSKFDQFVTLTGLCELRPEFGPFGISVCRGTLTRLDEAFRGYFRRIRAGQAPGYPRFRSVSRWDSLSWSDVSGWKLTESSRRLYLQGVGHVKANLHTPLRGTPKTLVVRRRGRHLEATVFCSGVPKAELGPTGNSIGIDLGVGVLVATSEGTLHPNPVTAASSPRTLPGHNASARHTAAARTAIAKRPPRSPV